MTEIRDQELLDQWWLWASRGYFLTSQQSERDLRVTATNRDLCKQSPTKLGIVIMKNGGVIVVLLVKVVI